MYDRLQRTWEDHLHLAEFSYNNSYQASIKMAPFEALYDRRCRSPLYWDEVSERRHLGPDVIVQAVDKIRTIQEHLRAVQDRQKSWADSNRRPLEFQVGECVSEDISNQGSDQIWCTWEAESEVYRPV